MGKKTEIKKLKELYKILNGTRSFHAHFISVALLDQLYFHLLWDYPVYPRHPQEDIKYK